VPTRILDPLPVPVSFEISSIRFFFLLPPPMGRSYHPVCLCVCVCLFIVVLIESMVSRLPVKQILISVSVFGSGHYIGITIT